MHEQLQFPEGLHEAWTYFQGLAKWAEFQDNCKGHLGESETDTDQQVNQGAERRGGCSSISMYI